MSLNIQILSKRIISNLDRNKERSNFISEDSILEDYESARSEFSTASSRKSFKFMNSPELSIETMNIEKYRISSKTRAPLPRSPLSQPSNSLLGENQIKVTSENVKGQPTRGIEGRRAYNLTIRNLTYKVKQSGGDEIERTLLNSVSANARPGELLAVVGPSGAGKSTFLDAIAGRINPRSLHGNILVNGEPMVKGFRRISAYVMQEDQLFAQLTVRETLMFSARLRLSNDITESEKKVRVEEIINQLGLQSCADTFIGNEDVRGVSGGEKRRVSIGVELIHDPSVLILDEPTSGLDSSSALNVMQILHAVTTQRNRTVMLTIHQPSFRILELVQTVLLLCRGHSIYHGPINGVCSYFVKLGAPVPTHVNIMDYAIDTLEDYQGMENGMDQILEAREIDLSQNSDVNQKRLDSMNMKENSENDSNEDTGFATKFFDEFITLCDRNRKIMFRSRDLFYSRITVMVVMGITLGTLFYNLKVNAVGAYDRNALFAFTVALLIYNSMDSLPIFMQERGIFVRETSRGVHRTSTYVLANAFVSLPIFLLLSVVLSLLVYWMVGLVRTFGAYLFFVFICFLTLLLANSFVLMWSGICSSYFVASGIVAGFFSYFFLFSGFFLSRSVIPFYWIWLHYFNIFKYSLEDITWNEFHRLKNECFEEENVEDGVSHAACLRTGQDILEERSLKNVSPVGNILVILLFSVFFRLVFYVSLRLRSRVVRD